MNMSVNKEEMAGSMAIYTYRQSIHTYTLSFTLTNINTQPAPAPPRGPTSSWPQSTTPQKSCSHHPSNVYDRLAPVWLPLATC